MNHNRIEVITMKKLTVERLEKEYIICKGEDERMYALLYAEAPEGLVKNDKLIITNEGTVIKA